MNAQLLVLAKAPVPGRVKTRLCPPCTPEEAAMLAGAALQDTLGVVRATPARRRVLAIDAPAEHLPVNGFDVLPQRGDGLGERIAAAFADAAVPGVATVLIGMDTPQVRPERLAAVGALLTDADAVLGPACDGGWWTLGLRDARHAAVLVDVAMSRPDTGSATRAALRAAGLRVAEAPTERDVDTAADAAAVVALAPRSEFAQAWKRVRARHDRTSAAWSIGVDSPVGVA
ncbi:DUF2064 domain-containing protein [Cryptosporangium sp. NPDC048952]|uniref:TIGR04282 family arsenosugar biosynthesis glycosyltransferase n=1 Tax=Cryptosporangium sp. NPDC048952 TaxID=3363961 RepID=UPI003720537C